MDFPVRRVADEVDAERLMRDERHQCPTRTAISATREVEDSAIAQACTAHHAREAAYTSKAFSSRRLPLSPPTNAELRPLSALVGLPYAVVVDQEAYPPAVDDAALVVLGDD